MRQVKAMKGVGGSAERLHSSSGPNQWEVVAMDYVDLNDLVPQVFFVVVILGFLKHSLVVQRAVF